MNRLVTRRLYSTVTGPSLHNIPQRWTKLKELDQADIVDHLALKSQESWNNLTNDEKKAMYFISFGEWGPRSKTPQVSISGTLLKGLFSGILFIAFGVSLYNYAIDEEYKAKHTQVVQKITEIKELENKERETPKKKYWIF